MDSDAIAVLVAVFGVLLLALACRRLVNARLLSASGSALTGLLLLSLAAVTFVVSLNLRTYARLTHEQPVAEIVFEAWAPQRYRATLTKIPSGEMQVFVLAGDEWQLDARVLKWHGWVNLFGFDAQYRLERVGGRYRDIEQERHEERTVYALSENPGVDLWQLATRNPTWLPFVDAVYGSATYLPMADGARYRVTLSQTGLIARPVNAAAQTTLTKEPTKDPKPAKPAAPAPKNSN